MALNQKQRYPFQLPRFVSFNLSSARVAQFPTSKMDKVTLLTASSVDRPLFLNDPTLAILSHITPALTQLFHAQQLLRQITLCLSLRAYYLATASLHVTQMLAATGYGATKLGAATSASVLVGTWESKAVQSMRKKMFHELATFVLGCGNPVFCLVFWPGWWVLGGTTYAVWSLVG